MTFPADDYTPHGYLDNRYHCRSLNPSGVVRSFHAGFRWHYPAFDGRSNLHGDSAGAAVDAGFAGSFGGRSEHYRAGFHLALGDTHALSDFDEATSPYHSKNVFELRLRQGDSLAHVSYHLVGEHALRARAQVGGSTPLRVHAEYLRRLDASGDRSEAGLVGKVDDDIVLLQTFPEGEVFAIWISTPWRLHGLSTVEEAAEPALAGADGGAVCVVGAPGDLIGLRARLDVRHGDVEVVMARGRTPAQARQGLVRAIVRAPAALSRVRAEDQRFWEQAPLLGGDWPAHWRRGIVYDLETVRMVVRDPVGIYRQPWDAMQIQAPRAVLAEAAMDALVLSYADPRLAQAMLLGTFSDAPAPNVPCSREDGSYNMVAADGSVSGTAPSWGFPVWVAEQLTHMRPDRDWLDALYPHLSAYVEWWLLHRRDTDGYLVYASTWESGQDSSPRFDPQPLGPGSPVRHIRPVDLQAAMAQAAEILGRFARTLDRSWDLEKWHTLAEDFRRRTARLWNGQRFADFDSRADRLTDVQDVMLAAPLALGVAEDAHRTAAVSWLNRLVHAEGYERRTDLGGALFAWPMFAWTAVEACLAVGDRSAAAGITHRVLDRAYRFWDERSTRPGRTLPGVACEYWPEHGRCGTEGYGWGAFGTHLLLRALVGFTPRPGGFALEPNLPRSWDGRYELRLWVRGRPRDIALTPASDDAVEVEVDGRTLRLGPGERAELPDSGHPSEDETP